MYEIRKSELILNDDGSIYHLNLKKEDIADTIILVGDKDRVPLISALFDQVDVKKNKREFHTHSGIYKGRKLSVISTGIGTDNIDIVLNELDALHNIDLESRQPKSNLTKLNFIRMGTCGSLQNDIDVNSFILSRYGIGFDNLMHYYKNQNDEDERIISQHLKEHLLSKAVEQDFYLYSCSKELLSLFGKNFHQGLTATASGFYGPQGRCLRAAVRYPDLVEHLSSFRFGNQRILNFEMETSAIYALSRLLGHRAITVNLVLANRIKGTASANYQEKMKEMASQLLDVILSFPE